MAESCTVHVVVNLASIGALGRRLIRHLSRAQPALIPHFHYRCTVQQSAGDICLLVITFPNRKGTVRPDYTCAKDLDKDIPF
jgi:hypothetical protein